MMALRAATAHAAMASAISTIRRPPDPHRRRIAGPGASDRLPTAFHMLEP